MGKEVEAAVHEAGLRALFEEVEAVVGSAAGVVVATGHRLLQDLAEERRSFIFSKWASL